MSARKRTYYDLAFPISLAFLMFIWEFFPKIFSIPPYVFPSISAIIENTFTVKNQLLFLHLKTTATEALLGFLLGSLIAFAIGVLMEQYNLVSKIILPYVIASNAIPVIALAPILILWFGNGIMSKIAVAAFLCFFPLCINTFKGLGEYKLLYKHLFDVYGASSFEFLNRFKLPNAMPFIITGLKLNAVYAVIGAIVAEFIGSDRGLGFGMLQASYSLNIPRLWGYIIVACLLGLLFYGIIFLLEHFILRAFHLHQK
jgi:ABC-type nitrate/sulfonate/bicarbonate transport system permease component